MTARRKQRGGNGGAFVMEDKGLNKRMAAIQHTAIPWGGKYLCEILKAP